MGVSSEKHATRLFVFFFVKILSIFYFNEPMELNVVLLIFLVIVGVLGIAMASIGIQFYRKCKDEDVSLNETNYQWLIWMLTLLCVMVFGILVYAGLNMYIRSAKGKFGL